ncbi:MAG: nuclear transport factor 2 family protein [Acidobacteriota bacterium]|nr:nuclear transport factor 2 family protein [Acidobacteriota bacterium]
MTSQDNLSEAMRETNRVFEEQVVGKGDFSALERVYTRQARILPPGAEMITGLADIQAFWQEVAVAMGVKAVKLKTVSVEQVAEMAFEIGRAQIDAASPLTVKYVVIWKREDGVWKWDVDIWNPVS